MLRRKEVQERSKRFYMLAANASQYQKLRAEILRCYGDRLCDISELDELQSFGVSIDVEVPARLRKVGGIVYHADCLLTVRTHDLVTTNSTRLEVQRLMVGDDSHILAVDEVNAGRLFFYRID